MNVRLILIASALFMSVTVSAKDTETCSHARQKNEIAIAEFPKRPYDIFLYRLSLDLRQAFAQKKPVYSGTAEIHLNTTAPMEVLELDAADQTMTRVILNGEEVTPTPQPEGDILSIPLPANLQAMGTHIWLVIDYARSTAENRGAYFYPKGYFVGLGPRPAQDSVFVEEDIFYTMSEPFDARFWMPCNDYPHEKMEADITVLVPSGISVTSNGDIQSFVPGDVTDRWRWVSDKPIPSYLMAVTASKYASWQEKVARYENPADSILLSYYVWQPDFDEVSVTDGSKYNAHNAFKNTRNMMTAFEKRFGPYPFNKYGQVAAQPIDIGGMEHQSMTTVNRSWMRGWSESGIAHELGHQWFGDKVTCETFKDIWLNEGFATYTEAIYNESWGGNAWYFSTMLSKAKGYFEAPTYGVRNDFPIYDPPAGELFNGAITYNKAGCVIHQLRRLVGNDSVFFDALRRYTDEFAYTNASTESFAEFMSFALERDLSEFFDQWIYGALHPDFSILWGQNAADRLYLRINQFQTVRDHFTMPLRFFAYHGNAVDTVVVNVASRSERWSGLVNGVIDSLIYDEDFGLLSTYSVAYDESVGVRASPEEISVSVELASQEIVCNVPGGMNYRVEVFDALGKRIRSETAQSPIHRVATTALASGLYTVRITDAGKSFSRSIPIAK